jgi:hypothetical protein
VTDLIEKKKAKAIPFKRRHPHEKHDFTVEYHSSIVLLRPNTKAGIAWANKHIGKNNGYQPYWPTVILEVRYIDEVIKGIRSLGLVARGR